MDSAIDSINTATMGDTGVIDYYVHVDGLGKQERAAIDLVGREVRDMPLLDIGVGGGRTTSALRRLSNDYLGIDYSANMVAACRRRHPGVRIEHMDARNMSAIPDASIAMALFAWNGICMVSHEDRLAILREVSRVLRPGGLFLFSTYNQNSWEHEAGFRAPAIEWTWNPARLSARCARYPLSLLRRIVNRRRNLSHEVRTPRYSVINDVSHDYATMLYYVDKQEQLRQLRDAGFDENATVLDVEGRPVLDSSRDVTLLFIARKRTASVN